jgi:hypothetical protein
MDMTQRQRHQQLMNMQQQQQQQQLYVQPSQLQSASTFPSAPPVNLLSPQDFVRASADRAVSPSGTAVSAPASVALVQSGGAGAGAAGGGGSLHDLGSVVAAKHASLDSIRTFRRQLERREVGARRLKYYFSQMSEVLSAEDFQRFTSELRIQIPLSCRAPYSLLQQLKPVEADGTVAVATPAAAAGAAAPSSSSASAAGAGAGGAGSSPTSASGGSAPPGTPVASEQLVVDFCWLSTPTVCMTDEASTHLAAPLALLRLERLSPFLEEPQLFLQRKQRAAEERKVTALALEAHARRASNNAGGGGGGSGGGAGGAGEQAAASRKRKRHHQNGHAQPTSGATLAPSQTQTTAPVASSASVAMSDRDASPSATSTVEGAGHASASSAVPSTSPPYPRVSAATATETSHSDSEESDASSDTDDSSSQLLGRTALVPGCTAPLTFPRPTKFHLASCEHRQRVGHHFYDDEGLAVQQRRAPTEERPTGGQGGGAAGGSTGGAATPGVSAGNGNKGVSTTPRLGKQRSVDGGSHHMQVDSGSRDEPECGCPPMQQVSMAIHINAEMERLIGLTQAELRALAVKEGAKAMDK